MVSMLPCIVFIPNRIFLVRILARRSRAKIPTARPNEPDIPPKRTKKVRLGVNRTQIRPSEHDIVAISGQ